ncbi:MAG: carbohydrate ABC transporter permease [Oscillospiraceae bacterium]|nr:carbohydrate ABC transporter permease [Oscillospiraceae bacterium]
MKNAGRWITFSVLLLVVIIMLIPFYLVIINSFKSYQEIVRSVISLPTSLNFDNFVEAFYRMNYLTAFLNTLLVTVTGTGGIVFLASMAGYQIARNNTGKLAKIIFFLLIIPIMIPFQSFMLSLVRVSSALRIYETWWGLALIYWGCGVPMAVFLYRGFCMGIPRELDEAAAIDGCNAFQTFRRIIFPVLKPVNATVIIINALWLWNDFLLPRLIIGFNTSHFTLQLQAVQFRGMYKMEWQLIMAGFLLTLIPAVIIYLIFQRQIVKGMVTGAVKG